ncbi:DgyrCDS8514 [Dimorphilus gyrociliatus]|uniref:Small nuclear ribonucleoprotein G n=1 Tax=Dimorphilus gyrociliatus TaxID=2664684 RepID=A0A7I8VW34_9ANNE|nr:DgyrCDS8514 [Dimorphilus gyrociliatus]
MSKAHPPELKKYMDKRVVVRLNGKRKVTGILRGFDPFMNMVLDNTVEDCNDSTQNQIGMCVVRGNSAILVTSLDRIG